MTNSIDAVLKSLISEDGNTEQLSNILNKLSANIDNRTSEKNDKTTSKFQLKINLINSIIPLLDNDARQMGEFLIKLLTIMSVLQQMKDTDNSANGGINRHL